MFGIQTLNIEQPSSVRSIAFIAWNEIILRPAVKLPQICFTHLATPNILNYLNYLNYLHYLMSRC